MRTDWNENKVLLRGVAAGAPELSHRNHGECYYVFPLCVARLSGARDTINIVCSARLLDTCPVRPCVSLEVTGEVRSFNNRSGKGSRLIITVFARTLAAYQGPAANELVLTGVLCKQPVLRCTPLGRNICDMILAVNRRYGRADYLPCIVWGTLAVTCGRLQVGQSVRVEGRLQSRNYRKVVDGVGEERTAFEISVIKLEVISQ
jgi:primosomal replication protein N